MILKVEFYTSIENVLVSNTNLKNDHVEIIKEFSTILQNTYIKAMLLDQTAMKFEINDNT